MFLQKDSQTRFPAGTLAELPCTTEQDAFLTYLSLRCFQSFPKLTCGAMEMQSESDEDARPGRGKILQRHKREIKAHFLAGGLIGVGGY